MVSPLGTSISGLQAAQTRLATASDNIANIASTDTIENGQPTGEAPAAKTTVQSTGSTGEVITDVVDVNPPTREAFAPNSPSANEEGIVELPNVNLEEEIVEAAVLAPAEFRANATVIRAQDEILREAINLGERGRQVNITA